MSKEQVTGCQRRWLITYANNKPQQLEVVRKGIELHKNLETLFEHPTTTAN